MIIRMFLLLLLYFNYPAIHDDHSILLPAKPEDSTAAKLITSFPFEELNGGVILVQVKINNCCDTLNFILDTGSGGISLDSAVCARMHLPVTASNKIIRGIGGSRPVSFALNNKLVLPGLTLDSLDFHISDYTFISAIYGINIDGIVGYSLLKDHIVKIDYDDHIISIYSEGKYKYPKGGQLLRANISFIPIIEAPMKNNIKIDARYFFDTGAALCVLLSDDFVKDSSVINSRKQRRHIVTTQVQGLLGKMDMKITTIKELRIGNYAFRTVPTYIFNDISNVTAYPFLGGVIGNDLLRRFNVVLNYPKREIFLKPNTHYKDRFDYSYTGLVMYFLDGKVVITDVIKDSPAAKAGFEPGDVILSIDKNFSNNIQKYRDMLKQTGSKVDVIIQRDTSLLMKRLPIKSIL